MNVYFNVPIVYFFCLKKKIAGMSQNVAESWEPAPVDDKSKKVSCSEVPLD